MRVGNNSRDVQIKDEDKKHDCEQCRGELRVAVPCEAEGPGEERKTDENDPEGMKGYPVRDAGGKRLYIEEMLGSEGGQSRGGEDAPKDDDLVQTEGRCVLLTRGVQTHGEENNPRKPRPEYEV